MAKAGRECRAACLGGWGGGSRSSGQLSGGSKVPNRLKLRLDSADLTKGNMVSYDEIMEHYWGMRDLSKDAKLAILTWGEFGMLTTGGVEKGDRAPSIDVLIDTGRLGTDQEKWAEWAKAQGL